MNLYMAGVVHQRKESQAAINLRTTFAGRRHDTAVGPVLRGVYQFDGGFSPAAVDVRDMVHRQTTVQAALADRAAVLLLNPQGVDDGWVALDAASEISPMLCIAEQFTRFFRPYFWQQPLQHAKCIAGWLGYLRSFH